MRGFDTSGKNGKRIGDKIHSRRNRKDSDSGSETDGRSLELASSHSSDDDETRTNRSSTTGTGASTHRSTAISITPSYLPNITEHVQATTPPELNVIQSPQLFPSINKSVYESRWTLNQIHNQHLTPSHHLHENQSSNPNLIQNQRQHNGETYLKQPSQPLQQNILSSLVVSSSNCSRLSQEDHANSSEHGLHISQSQHHQNYHQQNSNQQQYYQSTSKMTISPTPLPNPDLTDTSYLQQHHNKINMTPSILQNLQNVRSTDCYDGPDTHNRIYLTQTQSEDYSKYKSDSPSIIHTQINQNQDNHYSGSEHDYSGSGGGGKTSITNRKGNSSPIINHLRVLKSDIIENAYVSDNITYEKQRYDPYQLSYLCKKHLSTTVGTSSDKYGLTAHNGQYGLKKKFELYESCEVNSMLSVHNLFKNDYQQQQEQQQLQSQFLLTHDYHSDRLSDESDKNGYHFPYTAEEDHLTSAKKMNNCLESINTNLNLNGHHNNSGSSRTHTPTRLPSSTVLPSILLNGNLPPNSSHLQQSQHSSLNVNDINPGLQQALGRHTLNGTVIASRHNSRPSTPLSSTNAENNLPSMQPLMPKSILTNKE